MKVNSPVFFSFQVGDAGVYSKFISKLTNDAILSPIENVINEIISYIGNSKALIGLSLYGGGLAEPAIKALLQKCSEIGIKVSVDLSCCQTDIDFLNHYEEYINVVRILLYSMNSEKHDAMFKKNKYDDVMSFIEETKYLKKGKVLVIPILEDNWSEVPVISEFGKQYGFKINPLPIPRYCSNIGNTLGKESFNELLLKLAKMQDNCNNDLYLDVPVGYKYFKKPSICPALRLSFDVNTDGKVRPCKFSKLVLGNLNEFIQNWSYYSQIWTRSEDCNQCSEFAKCGGGCIGNKKSQ